MIFFHCVSILGLVDKGLRLYFESSPIFIFYEVSILGLVDKGLRLYCHNARRATLYLVSILGLVDKGLRQTKKHFHDDRRAVSILGLVDKGLRPYFTRFVTRTNPRFNPWFSG